MAEKIAVSQKNLPNPKKCCNFTKPLIKKLWQQLLQKEKGNLAWQGAIQIYRQKRCRKLVSFGENIPKVSVLF
ncbi:MAG: hypothetical protein FWC98_04055 [Bacteroidales bacterium]|nr:hypothetical protein [Bacteroidales bacterium]